MPKWKVCEDCAQKKFWAATSSQNEVKGLCEECQGIRVHNRKMEILRETNRNPIEEETTKRHSSDVDLQKTREKEETKRQKQAIELQKKQEEEETKRLNYAKDIERQMKEDEVKLKITADLEKHQVDAQLKRKAMEMEDAREKYKIDSDAELKREAMQLEEQRKLEEAKGEKMFCLERILNSLTQYGVDERIISVVVKASLPPEKPVGQVTTPSAVQTRFLESLTTVQPQDTSRRTQKIISGNRNHNHTAPILFLPH